MEELSKLIEETIDGDKLISCVLSKVKSKSLSTFTKLSIKPFKLKEEIKYQFEYFYDKKVIHKNLDRDEAKDKILKLLSGYFRQGNLFTLDGDYQILMSKKGLPKIIGKSPTKKTQDLSHNKVKNYIIKEDEKADFLIKLDVMSEDGKVFKKKYSKFRQINKFLEFIDNILKDYNKDTITIVDFGCGKAYLTYALYYYLRKRNISSKIIGLDLKEDVINYCNEVASDLNYEGLEFLKGDIKDFSTDDDIDMIITLHACDIATDEALAKAIKWNTKIILSVPCCQHEFFDQINNQNLSGMLKHGIVKERMASLVTDSARALLLEAFGYETDIMEFIDMEHTPKNILIRGIKSSGFQDDKYEEYKKLKEFWGFDHHFERLMKEELQKTAE